MAGERRTRQQHIGDDAESLVAAELIRRGWTVLARNVHAGRCELDLVTVDPGPPERLVFVEVRWRASRSFGRPEETIDWRKRAHLREAAGRLCERRSLPDGSPLPNLPIAVDLAVVEPGRAGPSVRLFPNVLAD